MEKNRNYYLGQKSSSTRSEGSFNHNSLKSQLNQSFNKMNDSWYNGTMQNRFLYLDNFFICLAYDDLVVGISDGTNCF